MKIQNTKFETVLNSEAIDICSEKTVEFLKNSKIDKRDIKRYSISLEEILLKYIDSGKTGEKIILSMGTKFFRPYVMLEIAGKAINVYTSDQKENGVMANGLLTALGLTPEYSYLYTRNRYFFHIKKKKLNPFFSLAIAIVSAFIIGSLGFLLPSGFRSNALSVVLTPLHDAFFNILGCIAGPMVFLEVAWGIYGIGDAATLRRVGKKILLNYIGWVYFIAFAFSLISIPLYNLTFSGKLGVKSGISDVVKMIFGIFPENIFSPFVNGNTLQIIFLAVVIGIAMLFLGQKTTAVAKGVEQINYIVQFLIEFISRLVPYFIFTVLLNMIWSDSTKILLKMGKLFGIFAVTVIFMAIGFLLFTSIKNRINVFTLIRKALPTFIIALTTASSAAAFGTNLNTCKNEFGIDESITSFGVPLGMVTFKPTTSLNFLAIILFFAETYKVQVSLPWIIIMIISVATLAISTPPIPGGAMTTYTVLFMQLGIPKESLALALACDTIFDFIDTGFDQFLLSMALLNQADKLGMVDKDKLYKKTNKKVI